MAWMAVLGLGLGGGDDHALAGGQAIGFYDDRRAAAGDEVLRRGGVGEGFPGGGGNAGRFADGFGEGLAAFQLRRGRAGPATTDPSARQRIGQPRHQRRFRAGDYEIDRVVLREFHQRWHIQRADGDVFAKCGGAGIARSDIKLRQQRRCRQGPGQSVLSAAAADD